MKATNYEHIKNYPRGNTIALKSFLNKLGFKKIELIPKILCKSFDFDSWL